MLQVEEAHASLQIRIRDCLERVSGAMRADLRSVSHGVGLSPTQAGILAFLAGRAKAGCRMKEIAAHLGVSQPTATDSVSALESKGFIQKASARDDARVVLVQITAGGRRTLKSIYGADSATVDSISSLSDADQVRLYLSLVKLIRHLQHADAISVQRMCVDCKYFRPNIYNDASKPHHCAFVNAAFGAQDVRLDCSDHEIAEPAAQAATWASFNAGTAHLQAI